MAWIIAAALIGYLALFQFGYVGTVFDDGTLAQLAVWNAVSAAITLYFGARLLSGQPGLGSIVWAGVSVAWGLYNVSLGATHEAYLWAIVAYAAAAILSYAAWRRV